MWLVFVGF